MVCNLPVIVSDKVNIWREVANYRAGLVCKDTVEGTTASLMQWQTLNANEVSTFRASSRRCFDEQFNYEVTAKRALEIVERVAHQVGRR